MPCTGMCCAAFPISGGIDRIDCLTEDGPQLLDMLMAITHQEAAERLQRVGSPLRPSQDSTYFTCRHFDLESRRCMDYDNRPAMCRNYPYGDPCEHGCDCKDARPLVWEGDYA